MNKELVEALREIIDGSGIAFDDDRLRWIEMQVDRDDIDRARQAIAKAEGQS